MQDLRLPSVTTIAIPEGYNWRELLTYIMKHHQMEMTGGLGPSIGMVSCSWSSGLYSGQINALKIVAMSYIISPVWNNVSMRNNSHL